MSMYALFLPIKAVHLTTVGITVTLFLARGAWMLARGSPPRQAWARVLPHVNDTVLLASGIFLAFLTGQSPRPGGWLFAKLLGLLAYIGLGMIALRHGRTPGQRSAAFLGAVAVLAYIIAVAVTRQPVPWA